VQRTIRALRVALPIVFFGFILLIAVSWNRVKSNKDRSATAPVSTTIRPNDKPQIESKTFEDTQTIAGRIAARIRARRVVAFQSGWNTLEDVQLTIFRPTGLTYELVCPQAQFNSTTKEADAKGGVKVTSSDGVEITTAEIHFDGNRLTNHIPVQFTIDRWKGRAGALDLDVQSEQLRLFEKFDATMQPATPTDEALNLKAREGVFRRQQNSVDFNDDVVMTRSNDRLVARHVVGRFTADRKTLVALEGEGNVDITMADDQSGAGGKEITCERFWSEMANGQISAIDADSHPQQAHAVIEGPPKRDIVAETFRVGLSNKVVSDVAAKGKAVVKELGETPRELSAEHITVYFDTRSHRAVSAAADGDFHYKDPKNEGNAVRANYDIVNDQVVLSADPGYYPTVVSDGQTLKAKLIEFSPRAGTAKATGEVIAQLVSKQNGPSADSTNVFPASKPVFVNSDSVTMNQAGKTAVFSGHVRAWQDMNTMFAEELQVQGMGDSIGARGNVRTSLYNTSTTEQRKTPVLSRSDHLYARKNERRIELAGSVKIDDEQRHMTSEKATFYFDQNRKIERIEAEEKVVLVEQPMGRKGTGDKAVYFVNRRVIYVNGSPATMTDPKGTLSGQQIAIDLNRNKVEIVSPTSATQGTYKQ
jgi:lipopolysaccharide export system protein LptA